MRLILILIALSATSFAESLRKESFEAFGYKWLVPTASDWKMDGTALQLLVPRPSTQPRRPTQYALADTPAYVRGVLELEVRKEPFSTRNRRTSLILPYAWKDDNHFNYAHLSIDTASQAIVHNGIFHVYGGDRVRMSPVEGAATLPDEEWRKVKLVYDSTQGLVEVYVDGKTSPAMRAIDLSLGPGKFGIGSFFDMGSFRNVTITGETVK